MTTTEILGKEKAPISEYFYSLQGEGRYTGYPAFFVRYRGCNLLCGRDMKTDSEHPDAEWECDTIDVWRKGKMMTNKELVDKMNEEFQFIDRLFNQDAHLILTGGEPLLHMRRLECFIEYVDGLLADESFPHFHTPFVEIETNGTITPTEYLLRRVNQWNVSVKLHNSGQPLDMRVIDDALETFAQASRVAGSVDLKPVITHPNDIFQVQEIVEKYGWSESNVVLMPGGSTQQQLDENSKLVAEQCKAFGYRMSSRLQVIIWNEVTGV